ncbi:MAG: alpha/beta hydrolase family protein [Bacteroidota bacterium]
MAKKILNSLYCGFNGREHTYDLVIPENFNGRFLLFMHGFMGFKDWGCWSLMMDHFIAQGFGFCRFNVTHNGTTPEQPNVFVDLNAFGNDSYLREYRDLDAMIGICAAELKEQDKLILIGHSRGGGMVLLGGLHPRVDCVISLAGISSIENRFPQGGALDDWKKTGVRYVHNSRTAQDLPQYFVQYEEFEANKSLLEIHAACRKLKKPVLLIHGERDHSVAVSEGYQLAEWLGCELQVIEGEEHTFGAVHPWKRKDLPEGLKEVCTRIRAFAVELG